MRFMAKLKLKFHEGKNIIDYKRAWIVLGDHAIIKDEDGTEHSLLSAECVTASEVESAVEGLKRQLDGIVKQAQRRFNKKDNL
jgi:hypothetical protein